MTTPTVTDEQIIAAYLQPMSIKDVARDLYISQYRVEKVLAAAAVAPVARVDYPHIRSVDGTFTCRCGAVSRPGAAESFRAMEFRWGKFTREHGGCE